MIYAMLRNLLALLSLLHFVSGPTQYIIASLSLVRAWYCMGEYVLFTIVGKEFSSTCAKVVILQMQEVK